MKYAIICADEFRSARKLMARGVIASFFGMFVMACSGCGGGGDGGSSPPQQAQQAAAPKPIDAANSVAFSTVERAKNVYVTPAGSFTVLTAGAGYSQAWIRDCATGVRAAYMVIGDA